MPATAVRAVGAPHRLSASSSFSDVPPGAWNVFVDAPGAVVEERAGVELAPGEELRTEVTLYAGADRNPADGRQGINVNTRS